MTEKTKEVRIEKIPISRMVPFKDHPFKVQEGEELDRLMESIEKSGVLVPVLVRPTADGNYEMISGHRRMAACKALGITELPAVVRDLSDEEAVIAMVDANLQRDHILPSEKAFAYKMKMDAMKRSAGRPSSENASQLGTQKRTDQIMAESQGESRNQIQRFIRLTNLIPELLKLVDHGDIALNTAVGLSYLKPYEQRWVQEAIEYEGCTPSLSQACRLKNASKTGSLDQEDVFLMMQEEKPNQRCTIKISRDKLLRYFPRNYTDEQMKQAILQSLEYLRRQRLREERDTR
jgi:ParB family chromosome partitioning protein